MASEAPTTRTALEQSFRDICAANGLDAISVGFNTETTHGFCAYAHRSGACGQGIASTLAASIAEAIANIRPAVALADEALPVELAA